MVADGRHVLGVIELSDVIKHGIKERFARLREMGVRTVMITGDNPLTAASIAADAGVDDYIAEARPEDKLARIRAEQQAGSLVAMVGDGTNDAPALAQADVGIAMGAAGSAVALETADVALMSDDLGRLPFAVRLSRQTSRIIRQNLIAALGIVVFLVIVTFLGMPMGPVVFIHEGSTLIVVANALRLLRFGVGQEHEGVEHETRPERESAAA